jgi:hypothetical protein
MRFRFVAVVVLALALGCAQTGNRDDAAAAQPAKKYKPDTPVTPRAMQPVPSSY